MDKPLATIRPAIWPQLVERDACGSRNGDLRPALRPTKSGAKRNFGNAKLGADLREKPEAGLSHRCKDVC
jgi:hypothetical protein